MFVHTNTQAESFGSLQSPFCSALKEEYQAAGGAIEIAGACLPAHFGHREHPDRSIVNTWIGIVNTWIGDRERSEATLGVQASG